MGARGKFIPSVYEDACLIAAAYSGVCARMAPSPEGQSTPKSGVKDKLQKASAFLNDYTTAVREGRVHPFTAVERTCRAATRDEPWQVMSKCNHSRCYSLRGSRAPEQPSAAGAAPHTCIRDSAYGVRAVVAIMNIPESCQQHIIQQRAASQHRAAFPFKGIGQGGAARFS